MNPLNPKICPKTMKRLPRRFAPVMLVMFLASHSIAQERNPFWDEYGNAPVMIQQTNNGASQTLKFVGFENGMLLAELDGGVGEVSLPVSESMVRDLRLDNSGMPEINRMISDGNYSQALERLRPKAYPLIKFHRSWELLHRRDPPRPNYKPATFEHSVSPHPARLSRFPGRAG